MVNVTEREEKRAIKLKKAKDEYDQWKELSQAHWNHWRAWGSWFSWGSPVGLGLFFALALLSLGTFIWLIHL